MLPQSHFIAFNDIKSKHFSNVVRDSTAFTSSAAYINQSLKNCTRSTSYVCKFCRPTSGVGVLDHGTETFFALRTGFSLALFCGTALNKIVNVWHIWIHYNSYCKSPRHWFSEIWVCFAAIRCSDLKEFGSQWHPQCVPYASRSSHFWTNLAFVPHSFTTGTGPRPGVCLPLS